MTPRAPTRLPCFGNPQALWVVEPDRRHDFDDLQYGGFYEDDWGGGWGEWRRPSCAVQREFFLLLLPLLLPGLSCWFC